MDGRCRSFAIHMSMMLNRASCVGLWRGAFIAPWDWRNQNKQTTILSATAIPVEAQQKPLSAVSAAGAPLPGCDIKGNVNKSGACIYHQPRGRWYAKINMELNGTRWFCSSEKLKLPVVVRLGGSAARLGEGSYLLRLFSISSFGGQFGSENSSGSNDVVMLSKAGRYSTETNQSRRRSI